MRCHLHPSFYNWRGSNPPWGGWSRLYFVQVGCVCRPIVSSGDSWYLRVGSSRTATSMSDYCSFCCILIISWWDTLLRFLPKFCPGICVLFLAAMVSTAKLTNTCHKFKTNHISFNICDAGTPYNQICPAQCAILTSECIIQAHTTVTSSGASDSRKTRSLKVVWIISRSKALLRGLLSNF